MISLHILESNPLSVTSFANIFSHFIGCLIILFMVSFVVKMVSSLIRPHLFIFAFVYIILGNRSKKMLLWFVSKCVLLMFSFRSFIVSGLTVRSLIYFYLIFVHTEGLAFSGSPPWAAPAAIISMCGKVVLDGRPNQIP